VLDDLAALGPFFAVSAHPSGASPAVPWRSAAELLRPSATLLERIDSVQAALAARTGVAVDAVERRVAASAVHLGLAARLTSPALGAAVLGRPLDLDPDGLWWQDVPGGLVPLSVPGPPLRDQDRAGGAGPGYLARGAGERGAAGEWDRQLLDEVLSPVTAAIASLVPVSGRVLWGNVASAVNAAARQVAGQRPEVAGDAWQAASRLFDRPALRGEVNPPGPVFRRSSCCLFYRLAPGSGNLSAICGDCVLGGRTR
jgi:FhuF 2Fe-2S C-terminal domain/Ferric iron reductase FhuF-like transporter